MVHLRREQQLVLARVLPGSESELRLAPRIVTVVRFDTKVAHVEVQHKDSESLIWWDVAGSSILLELRRELTAGDRLSLLVRFQDGTLPTQLVFQIVSHPGEVDTLVDVELSPRSARPDPEPEVSRPRREGGHLSRLVLSGALRKRGLTAAMFDGKALGTKVIAKEAWDYRAVRVRAIAFFVQNPEGAEPWVASEVIPRSPVGAMLDRSGQWSVEMVSPIAPGTGGWVVAEGPEEADTPLDLEVREKNGHRSVHLKERR